MRPPLRLGVIGLGRAFTLMLPTFLDNPLVSLVAAADPREQARQRFAVDFGGNVYATAEELCADPMVQAVYIASPHELHVEHVRTAARHRRHVLVEKPMATTIDDCRTMTDEAKQAGIHLLVGHSHSYDRPYTRTRELIDSGLFGRVRMINALNFTDFVYRPRMPSELDTGGIGGGVVLSQAAHQVDIVRLLAGTPALSVRAFTTSLDSSRPTQGAYNAQISFQDGIFASLTYSGYGRFDTDEFNNWIGETGKTRNAADYGGARQSLLMAGMLEKEVSLKNSRSYGQVGRDSFRVMPNVSHNHFGFVVVSCEMADLRPGPDGIIIYGADERLTETLVKPTIPRSEVVEELYETVFGGVASFHTGQWGLATLEICLGILKSSSTGEKVRLHFQG